MNTFKRKFFILAAVFAAIVLAGCTSNETREAEAKAITAASEVQVEKFKAEQEQAKAVQRLADKIDAGGASAYLLATALKGIGIGQAPAQIQVQAPQSVFGMAWQTLLQVTDIGLRAYGIKANRDVNLAQSNNNRDVSIASYGAFTSMGNSIASAGTAGYPYIQAPAPNVTTTTLSGQGVIGSGSYNAPVTTTTTTNRNCSGGTGAPGGVGGGGSPATTGGAGGTGGAAFGGNC